MRTRYFAVRGHRLHEEHQAGRAKLEYCKNDVMLVDALTKLAHAPVLETLHAHVDGGSSSEDSRVSSAFAGEPMMVQGTVQLFGK